MGAEVSCTTYNKMKLKTLKDLGIQGDAYLILQKEAIKWYHRSDGNKHKFIKNFFNITEEELK